MEEAKRLTEPQAAGINCRGAIAVIDKALRACLIGAASNQKQGSAGLLTQPRDEFSPTSIRPIPYGMRCAYPQHDPRAFTWSKICVDFAKRCIWDRQIQLGFR